MASQTGASHRRAGRERRTCLEVCDELGIDNDSPLRSKAVSYLTLMEGIQLSADVDDVSNADRLCSASAIFLAFYGRSSHAGDNEPPSDCASGSESFLGAPSSCRLGELLRHCNIGVKDFMEHLTLVAGRLTEPLSERLQSNLRVMKEGIVVTKMLHGKYRQLWNARDSLLVVAPSQSSSAAGDEVCPNGTASATQGSHDSGRFASLPPSTDPEVLPRLGWYLYLVTKEVLEFRSTNAAFMRCLNLILGALGALIWNSSPRSVSATADEDHRSQQKGAVTANGGERAAGMAARVNSRRAATSIASGMSEGECAGGRSGAEGGYGSEASLLAALSASGRCPASEVRAMSARVVEVVEALLFEGIVVSHSSTYSSQTSLGASPNPGLSSSLAAGENVGGADGSNGGGSAGSEGVANSAPWTMTSDTCRAKAVAGVFHPLVAADNAARLDACYWARISQRGIGGFGGVGVLDETFVLTPSLRDTVGTPRYGTSATQAVTLTPSVSRASRQLFEDYQKVSASAPCAAAPGTSSSSVSSLEQSLGPSLSLSTGNGTAPGASNLARSVGGFHRGTGEGEGAPKDGGAFGILQSPLTLPEGHRGGGGAADNASRQGIEAIVGRNADIPPETPVMAVMETVRWIASLDSAERGPPASLSEKLDKCATSSPSIIQERLVSLLARLDGPASAHQSQSQRPLQQNTGEGLLFGGRGSGDGGGQSVEASVLEEAKGKGKALYYITLEALLDMETSRLGVEDHSRLLRQGNLHEGLIACCLEVVFKASSLLSLTFPWVLRRMEIDALDLCKVLESFARFCPGLPTNLKYHLYEVQTEIVERLALEDGAGVFRLIREHKAVGEWPVSALWETDVAPPTGSRLDALPSPQKRQVQQQIPRPENAEGVGAAREASTGAGEGGGERGAKARVAGEVEAEAGGGAGDSESAQARARTSTLEMYFRKLLQRSAEVVAELCLKRLRLPGDTADQVWTVIKRCVAQRTEMLKDRHLHHVILCSTYSVCKVNCVTPEVTFKRIIEQYKQLSGAGGGLGGGVGTPRLSIIKDILLKEEPAGDDAAADRGGGGRVHDSSRRQERGDIIKFYNQVYIPAMKRFVLEFKNLAGQQQGVASISNAQDAVRVAKHVLSKRSIDATNHSAGGVPEGGRPGVVDDTACGSGTPSASLRHRRHHRRATPSSDDSPPHSSTDREDERGSDVDKREVNNRDRRYSDRPRDADGECEDDSVAAAEVVAAGAALSALSSAPHPQMPLVSQLPSQPMASPKRVQENVYLTTVTAPTRSGGGVGFARPAASAASSTRAGGSGSGGSARTHHRNAGAQARVSRGEAGVAGQGVGGGGGGGGGVYAFGKSLSKDLQVINRTVNAVWDDGSSHQPPSSKRARSSRSATQPPR